MTSVPILITGSDGFIGRHLCAFVAGAIGPVRAGTRRPITDQPPGDLMRVACDLDSDLQVGSAVAGASIVVHAAYASFSAMLPQCRRLLQAMADAGTDDLIYFSSIAVYGNREGHVDETADVAEQAERYGQAKIDCERLIARWVAERPAERRAVILRPGIVYGRGSTLWIDQMLDRMKADAWGTFGARGQGTAALVHVDDVTAVVLAACERLQSSPAALPRETVLNVIGPETPTWNGYFAALAAASRQGPLTELSARQISLRSMTAIGAKIWRRLGLPGARGAALAPTRGELALFARKAEYASPKVRNILGAGPSIDLTEGLKRTLSVTRE